MIKQFKDFSINEGLLTFKQIPDVTNDSKPEVEMLDRYMDKEFIDKFDYVKFLMSIKLIDKYNIVLSACKKIKRCFFGKILDFDLQKKNDCIAKFSVQMPKTEVVAFQKLLGLKDEDILEGCEDVEFVNFVFRY